MRWIRGAKRLPGLFTKVKWRNADGGNIPLPDATPLEHYQRTGANINWHEWLDESESSSPSPLKDEIERLKNLIRKEWQDNHRYGELQEEKWNQFKIENFI